MSFALTPLLTADPVIQFHAASALVGLLLGPVVLYRPRRDTLHKTLGYVWVAAMAAAALSSFGIHGFGVIGPFSPLHLLAILLLWGLFAAIRDAVRGNIAGHQRTMRNLYWRGVIIAGLFNFLPGRTTNRMFFPETPEAGYAVIALGILGLLAMTFGAGRFTWRRVGRIGKKFENPLAGPESIH